MNTNLRICLAMGACTFLLLPGCASVVSGRRAEVAINSHPSGALVSVHDSRGAEVAAGRTPAVVSLKRGDGFFKPARYTATIEKPGYRTAQVEIGSKLNPWLLGNVALGGVVGLVVDPYTGAMWKPNPSDVYQNLAPLAQADATYQADATDVVDDQVQPASTTKPHRRQRR